MNYISRETDKHGAEGIKKAMTLRYDKLQEPEWCSRTLAAGLPTGDAAAVGEISGISEKPLSFLEMPFLSWSLAFAVVGEKKTKRNNDNGFSLISPISPISPTASLVEPGRLVRSVAAFFRRRGVLILFVCTHLAL